ncbi:hypothetical protein B0H14DRAFT_2593485 [Mycena olivaceomarginata]|nr:hypothetical protein B0H14DRAFT_2593485 [Mycena olivaceomarginata]
MELCSTDATDSGAVPGGRTRKDDGQTLVVSYSVSTWQRCHALRVQTNIGRINAQSIRQAAVRTGPTPEAPLHENSAATCLKEQRKAHTTTLCEVFTLKEEQATRLQILEDEMTVVNEEYLQAVMFVVEVHSQTIFSGVHVQACKSGQKTVKWIIGSKKRIEGTATAKLVDVSRSQYSIFSFEGQDSHAVGLCSAPALFRCIGEPARKVWNVRAKDLTNELLSWCNTLEYKFGAESRRRRPGFEFNNLAELMASYVIDIPKQGGRRKAEINNVARGERRNMLNQFQTTSGSQCGYNDLRIEADGFPGTNVFAGYSERRTRRKKTIGYDAQSRSTPATSIAARRYYSAFTSAAPAVAPPSPVAFSASPAPTSTPNRTVSTSMPLLRRSRSDMETDNGVPLAAASGKKLLRKFGGNLEPA